VIKLRDIGKKININGPLLPDEPLSLHTSFRTGGPADLLALPRSLSDLRTLLDFSREESIPWMVLGGGANVLAADRGVRGLVIGTELLKSFSLRGEIFRADAGLDMSVAAWETGAAGLAGLHSFYAMPGTLGGAVWMNARCYDRSVSEVLTEVTLLDPLGNLSVRPADPAEFDYKLSPFQKDPSVILQAEFRLHREDSRLLRRQMEEYREDRYRKGHFAAPSAGSVFKNNRAFGAPSGKIIDQAGLKGTALGGALVSPDHGNIIFNAGGASSADIRNLIDLVRQKVLETRGLLLEEEVRYIGDWQKGGDTWI